MTLRAKTLFDHHIHSTRSDGTVTLEDRAKSVAVRPHGVSDHFPWRTGMKDDDDVLRYVDDATRLGLRVGIEYDLGVAPKLRATTRDALDYMIGSLHQIEAAPGEWIVYGDAGTFLKAGGRGTYGAHERFSDPDLAARILRKTIDIVRSGIEEHRIDILGHPTMSPLAPLGYPDDWQDELVELCRDAGVALEINESYGLPDAGFLRRAHAAGARFSIGSDSHGELLALDRTDELIARAHLPRDRFVSASARQAAASSISSS